MDSSVGEVFLLKTNDRAIGVRTLMEKCGLHDYSGSGVAVKANFNSADPFPASTIFLVMLISFSEGVTWPDGWL